MLTQNQFISKADVEAFNNYQQMLTIRHQQKKLEELCQNKILVE